MDDVTGGQIDPVVHTETVSSLTLTFDDKFRIRLSSYAVEFTSP